MGDGSFIHAVRGKYFLDFCFAHEMSCAGFGSSVCVKHTFTVFDGESDFVDVFVCCMHVVHAGDGENLERSFFCTVHQRRVECLESGDIGVGLDEIGEDDVVLSNELLEIADLLMYFVLWLTLCELFADP